MKAIFQITAAATAVAAALALQLPAVAQTAGTVDIGGQVTPTTCVLLMKNTDDTDRQITTKSIPLGTVRSVSGVDQPMGSFSVLMAPTLPGNNDAWCNQGGLSWNLMLDLNSSQIQTLSNGNTVLKNAIAPGLGGTDAGVALYGSEEGQNPSRLTLKTGSYTLGTKVSATNVLLTNKRIGLTATLVATSASAATAGQFQALVPLVILYN